MGVPGREEDVGRLLDHRRHRRPGLVDAGPGRSSTAGRTTRAPWAGSTTGSSATTSGRICSSPASTARCGGCGRDLEDFPRGFGHCEVALQAKIFEASHTYRLKGRDKYLTIVEEDGRRYYKAYLADRLDGPWTPLADTADKPFAGWKNIRPATA